MRKIVVILLLAVLTPVVAGCQNSSGASPQPQSQAVVNEQVTTPVRNQLIAAAAKINGNVPVTQYAGLEPGRTYYAFDPATKTYWAGAGLVPRSDSAAAAVSVQDNGSYNLFRRTVGGSWTADDVGLAGVGGTRCPIEPPATILRLWAWPTNTCHPA